MELNFQEDSGTLGSWMVVVRVQEKPLESPHLTLGVWTELRGWGAWASLGGEPVLLRTWGGGGGCLQITFPEPKAHCH